jgi:hypothetical protein
MISRTFSAASFELAASSFAKNKRRGSFPSIVDATLLMTRSMLMYSMPQKWSPRMPLMADASKMESLNAIGTYVKPTSAQMAKRNGRIKRMAREFIICALTFLELASALALPLLPATQERSDLGEW